MGGKGLQTLLGRDMEQPVTCMETGTGCGKQEGLAVVTAFLFIQLCH